MIETSPIARMIARTSRSFLWPRVTILRRSDSGVREAICETQFRPPDASHFAFMKVGAKKSVSICLDTLCLSRRVFQIRCVLSSYELIDSVFSPNTECFFIFAINFDANRVDGLIVLLLNFDPVFLDCIVDRHVPNLSVNRLQKCNKRLLQQRCHWGTVYFPKDVQQGRGRVRG